MVVERTPRKRASGPSPNRTQTAKAAVLDLDARRKAALEIIAATQPPRDLRAWKRQVKVMRERSKLKSVSKGRTWTREDLYDRPSRYSR